MEIKPFQPAYLNEVISLILDIQNNEAKISLSLAEQPDLLNIESAYFSSGGKFWIAIDDNHVVGTIAVMKIDPNWCVLKKFFIHKDFRCKKIGLALYETFLEFVKDSRFSHIILDTPSVAHRSHSFYKKAGFRIVDKNDIPMEYHYPDRDSLLFRLDL